MLIESDVDGVKGTSWSLYTFSGSDYVARKNPHFQKFKQALRNFEETKKTRIKERDKISKNVIMKTESTFGTSSKNKGIICYSCGIPGHKNKG